MTLPYDFARCPGVQYDGDWREGCDDCLRRTSPGDPDRQVWMGAPLLVVFECEYRIGPREGAECRCGELAAPEWHECPYESEINNNDDPHHCRCCDGCTHECAMDI